MFSMYLKNAMYAFLMMALVILASVYFPPLAYGFAVFQTVVVSLVALVFLMLILISGNQKENAENVIDSFREKMERLIDSNDGTKESKSNIRKKVNNTLSGFELIINKRQRNISTILNCFYLVLWAFLYKYIGYETIAYIVLMGSVAIPALKSIYFEKVSNMCYDEIVQLQEEVNNKIKTHL